MSLKPNYLDENLDFEERARDLVDRMTLDEKVTQMVYNAPAIPRLGIKSYNWWNEALHGVARAGVATVFPQAIGLAAMFDDVFLQKIADTISTEARAKYNESQRKSDHGIYKGLTFWSPNINIFRDPRWGRGHETYGEDPYLTGMLGVAFVKGLQGDHPKYLKAAACAKHFAVHSGPESERHSFNAEVSKKDLRETYLPAFEKLVKDAKVEAIMGAYNRTNGEPCCGSKTLLVDILRNEWGFEGHVVSDCWAIKDFHETHMVTKTIFESVALAVNNGCDLNCGNMYAYLLSAHSQGLVTEENIDKCVIRLMKTRIRLGMLDSPESVPYTQIPFEENDCTAHNIQSLEAAKKSMVLLKNSGLLPLDKNKIKTLAVIGPNADSRDALIGNYHGTASSYITALEGIKDYVDGGINITYAPGCHLYKDKTECCANSDDRIAEACSVAERADVVILCLGLDEHLEGEGGDESNEYGSGDKRSLNLPTVQQQLLEKILEIGKPVVVVLFSGSALAVNTAQKSAAAIIQAWYPGSMGGQALAQLLFGQYSPSGRLPVTFYKTTEELPDFHDYSMKGRTYRYMTTEPLYPFGYGLSYAYFEYSPICLSDKFIDSGKEIECSISVTNTSEIVANEVVQLYLKDVEASIDVPKWSLHGFINIELNPQETKKLSFSLSAKDMSLIDSDGKLVLEPGEFEVYIGGSQPDNRSRELSGNSVKTAKFVVK